MKKIINSIFIGLIFSLISCETMEDPETRYASTYPISGEYYVQYSHIDATNAVTYPFGTDFYSLYIYNTVLNDGKEVWITDNPNSDDPKTKGIFWNYRVKIDCNPNAAAFGLTAKDSTTNDIYSYGIKVGIYNGKILKLISKQSSGTMADSISFDLIFEDSGPLSTAGDTIKVKGNRKTGFLEDDH